MNALILIDIQNDFCPGGALAVPEGDQVVPIANRASLLYPLVVATQDWHPPDHGSFAANHPGKNVYDLGELGGLPQVLWPAHCVQNTPGAELHPNLDRTRLTRIFHKGTDPTIDSYSAFFDNGHKKSTGLGEWLRERGVTAVDLLGLATDYCVKFSALDAVQLGFTTRVIVDGCRGVGLQPGDIDAALSELHQAGVALISSDVLSAPTQRNPLR